MPRIVPGSGAIITPVFNSSYGVEKFIVEDGGVGYDRLDPPKIELIGQTPVSAGEFYPIIVNGSITAVRVISSGYGYSPNYGDFESVNTVAEITRSLSGNNIVGITSFKLTSQNIPLFYREFDSSNGIGTFINLDSNSFIIEKHNFQTGQKIFYDSNGYLPIGIGTTSSVESSIDIIIEVGGSGGGSIYENGYNVSISTSISGISSTKVGSLSKVYGFGNPIPSYSITGVGTGAKFEVYITYNDITGSALSTSIVLKEGGGGYSVGNRIGISGTYLGGLDPGNNLSFFISKLSSSRISGQANQVYTNVSGITSSGPGSGVKFNITRDGLGDINSIKVVNGGAGYALTSSIKINGTDVGGNNNTDNVFVSPTVLGTNVLPNVLYVDKLNDNSFRVSGTPSSEFLTLESLGIGNHSFTVDNPNSSSIILVDNIIQSPLYIRDINVQLSEPVGVSSTSIYLNVGISSISSLDFLKIDDEYLKIENIGIGGTNAVQVSRGYFGSTSEPHTINTKIDVVRGDYNIVKDSIYFSTPPYGEIGPESLKVSSNFQGKVFSRSFDLLNTPNDKNLILDDISISFTGESQSIGIRTGTLDSSLKDKILGIDTTSLAIGDVLNLQFTTPLLTKLNTKIENIGIGSITIVPNHNVFSGVATTTFNITRLSFVLKSNKDNVLSLYNDVNGSGVDINNNPIILINNIPQVPEKDFTIDTSQNNTIKFLSGVPNAGRIVKTSLSTSFGYAPLVGAAATISISGIGTVSRINITNPGSGYRTPPTVSLGGTVGGGASFSATIGAGGTVVSINVINPGTGYTSTNEYFYESGISTLISAGSTTIYVDSTSYVSVGSSISIVGTAITNARIVSFGSTFVNIGSGSTINSQINSGLRVIYTTFSLPEVIISPPPQYSNVPLSYLSGTFGSGKNATASIVVGNGSSVISFEIDEPGYGYKYGDKLVASGIVTDPKSNSLFKPLIITVTEELTDKFVGFYPGQFIKIDDISQFFNGKRRKFSLTKTEFGVKDVLDLKVDPGIDLNIQNNIFVYLNDILQEPEISYTFTGTKIIFSEPPKENSSCLILYFRGSSLDVEEIIPPKTLKEGDIVQIIDNKDDIYDITQFERNVKSIVSSSEFDTLAYGSVGIDTINAFPRPLKWKKQTEDKIINGVLYSKSREGLKAKIIPTTKIIKSVSKSDSVIYVENVFPLFSLDETLGLIEDKRNILLLENKEISIPKFSSVVSSSSTISNIGILDGGYGFNSTNPPDISISSSYIKKQDPILNWKSSSGIGTNLINLNSITYKDYFISIGSSGRYASSLDGIFWKLNNTGFNVDFNDIVVVSNNYIGVGSDGTIVKGVGIGTTIPTWTKYALTKRINQFGFTEDQPSNYDAKFNKISYMPSRQTFVAVGNKSLTINYSPIFVSVGIGNTQFIENARTNQPNLNSVANNNQYFVVVGNQSKIIYSIDDNVWTNVGDDQLGLGINRPNLNDVVWDGSKFIAVGDNGTIISASIPNNWNKISTNITFNIKRIKYYDNFYVILDFSGNLYYSFDLQIWTFRSTLQNNAINDLIFVQSIGDFGRYVAVGSASTTIYSEPTFNKATATAIVSGGTISDINITNGGFGYSVQDSPPVIAKSTSYNKEQIKSVKVKGDFGTVVDVTPVGTATTELKFTLKIESYDNLTYSSQLNSPGIGYSSLNTFKNQSGELILSPQLGIGDYFVIKNSNVTTSKILTGITTYNGTVETVGIITSTLDGVYSVEDITTPDNNTGIVTVTCRFGYISGGSDITTVITKGSNKFYGNYSWGKIYGYQNRSRGIPKQFNAYTNNGIIGLSTSSEVMRTRELI